MPLGGEAGVTVELLGAKQLTRQLNRLSEKGGRRAIRLGAGAAVRVIKKGIKSEIPGNLKRLKKAVGSKVKVNSRVGIQAKVGMNVGKKKGRGYVPHAAIYVLGTGPRHHKSGHSTGRMPANDVVYRGFKKTESQAERAMREKMAKVIAEERDKL